MRRCVGVYCVGGVYSVGAYTHVNMFKNKIDIYLRRAGYI